MSSFSANEPSNQSGMIVSFISSIFIISDTKALSLIISIGIT